MIKAASGLWSRPRWDITVFFFETAAFICVQPIMNFLTYTVCCSRELLHHFWLLQHFPSSVCEGEHRSSAVGKIISFYLCQLILVCLTPMIGLHLQHPWYDGFEKGNQHRSWKEKLPVAPMILGIKKCGG